VQGDTGQSNTRELKGWGLYGICMGQNLESGGCGRRHNRNGARRVGLDFDCVSVFHGRGLPERRHGRLDGKEPEIRYRGLIQQGGRTGLTAQGPDDYGGTAGGVAGPGGGNRYDGGSGSGVLVLYCQRRDFDYGEPDHCRGAVSEEAKGAF